MFDDIWKMMLNTILLSVGIQKFAFWLISHM